MKLEITREQLSVAYAEVLAQNDLLARVEGQTRTLGWTDQEIRTVQLLLACKSNKSLSDRVRELERLLHQRYTT